MNSRAVLCIALILSAGCCRSDPPPPLAQSEAEARPTYAVLRVIDGDTFTIMYDEDETSVRLWDFDAPEAHDPGGPEATAALKGLIEGKSVTLEFPGKRKRDHFGRLLCRVYVNGVDVCEALASADRSGRPAAP